MLDLQGVLIDYSIFLKYRVEITLSPQVEKTVKWVLQAIEQGRLVGGERLVEARLAELNDTGIGPVREALQYLYGAGIVSIVPYKGARVVRLSQGEVAGYIALGVALLEPQLRDIEGDARKSVSDALTRFRQLAVDEHYLQAGSSLLKAIFAVLSDSQNSYMPTVVTRLLQPLIISWMRSSHLQITRANDSLRLSAKIAKSLLSSRQQPFALIQELEDFLEALWVESDFREEPFLEAEQRAAPADSATQLVISYIEEDIRKGLISPGQRLVEADLIAATSVGRTPVRQALRVLVGDNVLELLPNVGVRLKQLSRTDLADILVILDASSKLGIRQAIARAVKNPKDAVDFDSRVLVAQAKTLDVSQNRNAHEFMRTIIDYHRVVNEFSDNAAIQDIYDVLHMEFFLRSLAGSLRISDWEKYINRYNTITSAVLDRDASRAQAELALHVRDLLEILDTEQPLIY